MIHYNLKVKQYIINEHFDLLKPYLINKINESTLNSQLLDFIKKNLEDIITETPSNLLKLNKEFKNLKKFNDSDIIRGKIKKIFNYKYFSSKKDNIYDGYDLSEKLNIRTCLYCNRNYTLTVSNGKKKQDKYTRPEFDHFFDKDTNPLLGLSIYNLIPSCKICNTTLKGIKKFDLLNYIHPFTDDVISFYKYKFIPHNITSILGNSSNLSVAIEINSGNKIIDKKIKKSYDVFKLDKIMSAHSEELKDLFDVRYRFSERYFVELFDTYRKLGLNKDDVYRIVFGTHINETDFSKRPFSKLKKDILKELNIIS